jgi:hypothetical protein
MAAGLCFVDAGHIPALSCAPDLRVADCLSMILRQMFPQAFESPFKEKQTNDNGEIYISKLDGLPFVVL